MNWLNIYPLIKDPVFLKMSDKEELKSLWVPINKIGAISFGRKKPSGKYMIEIIFDETGKSFEQEFQEFDEAIGVWKSLQLALGIKVPRKKGPKPKYFEILEEELNTNADTREEQ